MPAETPNLREKMAGIFGPRNERRPQVTREPQEPPPPPEATDEERQAIRRFVEQAPLYAKLEQAPWNDGRRRFLPDSAEGYCERCRTTRTFSQLLDYTRRREAIMPATVFAPLVKDGAIQGGPDWPAEEFERGVYSFSGVCTYCQEGTFVVVLDINPAERWVRKIGQRPAPWQGEANPLVRDALGEDFRLFQKARVLIGSGFGVGACAYLRRIVEDRINPLVDRLIQFERERGASEERVREFEAVRAGRDFSAKAAAVYSILPEAVQVPGHNPIRTVHSAYSAGMHGLTDDECLEIAQDTVEVLEHIVVHLAQRPRKHRNYVDKIKDLDRRRAEWD